MLNPNDSRAWTRAIVLALFLCPVLWQTATAVDVPPKHPVYDFLLRMEARGLFESPLPQTMPYTREDVVRRLTLLRGHWEALNGLEKREAGEYLSQLADSTGDDADGNGSGPLAFYRNGHDLAELRGPAWRVAGNPVFEARQEFHRLSADSNGAMSVWASGFEVHGVLRHFGFSVRATDAHVRGDAKLADRTDFPYRYDVRPSGFDYDEADAGISYEVPHAALFFGKARNHWGSGRFESLILSDQPTSYTQFRGRFTLGPVELTALQAKLQQRPPVVVGTDTTAEGIVRRDYAEKFLAAHRLQVNVSRWLQVGIYEAVVYGERSFDLDYVNPMMFLRSAEHYADDRDNALMGFDLKWRPLRDVLLHGDLLIDDVSTTHLGEGFFGNKLGFQGGAEWYDPAGLSNTRLVCEYTRIEPYVYSHKFAINSYQHYGSVLGASTGPNSDVLTASLAWTVSRPVQLEVWTQWRRHGANPASGTNVGGDPRRPWGPGDAQHVHFLDGDKETFRTVGLQGRVEMIHDLYVAASASVTSSDTRFMAGGKRSETRSLGMAELRWNPW